MPASDTAEETHHASHPWHHVLWLTGVDYFSTLGYQPGIAFLAAGALAPLATLVLIKYLLWGEGETGILVYEILVRYWHTTEEDDMRPYIFLVSE